MSNAVLARLVAEREQANETINRILDGASGEDRQLSESERQLLTRQRAELESLEPQIVELVELEETRTKAADARAHLERQAPQRPAQPVPGQSQGEGEGEYQTFAQYARDQILTRFDQVGASVEPEVRQRAVQRLQRAVETVTTPDVPGLLRPQYIDQIMQVIGRDRPLVSSARMIPLTNGTLQYPAITARPTVAKQVTEKTEVGTGTMTVAIKTVTAETFLSSANLSWQTVQWSSPDAMALWFDLAAADYALKTDAALAAKIAAADTTPSLSVPNTIEGWTAAIAAAAGRIYANTRRRADTVYTDVVTGFGIIGLASAVSPTFLATGGANLASGSYPSVGGLRMVISPQLPADCTVVADSTAIFCAETSGSPVQMRAVEPSIGGIEIGIIGAFACELVEAGAFEELHTAAT